MDLCPVFLVCTVCNVGVSWPNGRMDQDALGTQIGFGPGDIVLDGDHLPLTERGTAAPPLSWFTDAAAAHVYCGQAAGWLRIPLCMVRMPRSRRHCVCWGPSSPHVKGHRRHHISAHVYCGQTVAHLRNCCALVKLPPGYFYEGFLQRAQCSHCKRSISYSNSVCLSVCPSVCLSVRPSVRHTPVLCQNDDT